LMGLRQTFRIDYLQAGLVADPAVPVAHRTCMPSGVTLGFQSANSTLYVDLGALVKQKLYHFSRISPAA
jgi:hypothetical protein